MTLRPFSKSAKNKLFAEYCSVENVAFDFHLKYLRFRRNNKCPQLLLLDWV